MRLLRVLGILAMIGSTGLADDRSADSLQSPAVERYLAQRASESAEIPRDRREQLDKIARYVSSRLNAGQPAQLVFICTHNSRRSHLSQIWAAVAAGREGLQGVETYSGGTEATAFNPRAVAALQRAGLTIEKTTEGGNPQYAVHLESQPPLLCFSKVYTDPPNPTSDFCAVLTCSQADETCPLINGCALRVALPYDDPKAADGTAEEAAAYDARSAQICREMLNLFSQVKAQSTSR